MVWVASATRLKRDLPTFREALRLAPAANTDHLALVLPVDGSAIIERWHGSRCPVYLDFGNERLGLPGFRTCQSSGGFISGSEMLSQRRYRVEASSNTIEATRPYVDIDAG
ncbi:hypothetical protein CO655_12735 [Rhizobium sp. M1]|nr:hypothetical protein CO655_12735 [Rhizobium sp. M1]